ncbi:MAG: PAS domain-containing protein, partial [Saprospiraceae bacterium]
MGRSKHEWALGQPTAVVWAEIWDFCGPLSDKVYQRGESSFVNDSHFFMKRGDLLEEVYYSFSYSPIYDETGTVGGLFCPNIETTTKMLNERRLHTLSELAAKALIEKTTQAACASAFTILARNREDIPFALLYLLDGEGRHATLEQASGLLPGETTLSPAIINLSDGLADASPWPLSAVLQNTRSQVVPVDSIAGLPLGLADLRLAEAATYVDHEMWEKIVLNLLSNAFKYTLAGSVRVRLFTENDQAVLTVQDTGVGIPAPELPRMFERFHRVQNAVGRSFEGTGIGLSLVSELVKIHGGSITVDSQEKEGSTFTVRIPLGKAHLPAEQVDEQEYDFNPTMTAAFLEESITFIEEPTTEPDDTDPAATTILVVDDNADMRTHITTLLQRHYSVITARNGAEALEKIGRQVPILVLSDIMMPVMDGLELLKAIKENPRTAQIPVVLLSTRAGEESRIEGFEIGADDYLIKPFSAKELLARLRSQIRLVRSRAHVEQQLRNLFIQAPVAVCIFRGPKHVVEVANKQMLDLMGRTSREIMDRPVFEAIPDMPGQGFEALLDQVYQRGERFLSLEMPLTLIRHGVTEQIYIKFVCEPLREEDGRISGIMAVADEITVLVKARQLAQRVADSRSYAYEQIRNLFLQAPTAIQILRGPDFIVELANNRLLELWGKTETEVLNRPLFDIIPEVRAQGFDKLLERVYQTGQRFVAEEIPLNFMRDGQLINSYAKLVYEPLRDADGHIYGIMVVGDDITPQVLARQNIEESETRFRTLAETLPQLVWITDQSGAQEYASSRWEEYTGIKPSGTATWQQMVHPDDMPAIAAVWDASIRNGKPYKVEVRLKNKQGDYCWHFVQAEPIRGIEGQIVKWIGAFTNIHDQKTSNEKLEQQVAERTADLYRSNESLETNNRQLLRAIRELESFNYVASHDLQEPLRKIQ